MTVMVGQKIGSYVIEEKLGEGGMGVVFRARHAFLDRLVAIKILHGRFAADPQIGQRFLNEARAVNIIDHPSVVQISEVDRLEDGTLYLVMELLRGVSLREHIQSQGVLSGRESLRILRQLAEVLAAAHAKNIIHRDLKPENIMLTKSEAGSRGQLKLLDFGIAKLAAPSPLGGDQATQTNMMMGTPSYMSPEQCLSPKNVDGQSDVYALGIITYQMLSGQLPFPADSSIGALFMAHMQQEPPPLRSLEPSVSENIAALVHRMLAKEPHRRPSAKDIVAEVDQMSGGGRDSLAAAVSRSTLGHAAGQALPSPAARPRAGRTWLLGGAALALLVTIVGLAALLSGGEVALTPAAPDLVTAKIDTVPAGAKVSDEQTGEVLGTTPCSVKRPLRAAPLRVKLEHEGYEPLSLTLAQDRDLTVTRELKALPQAAESAETTEEPERPSKPQRPTKPERSPRPPKPERPPVPTPDEIPL